MLLGKNISFIYMQSCFVRIIKNVSKYSDVLQGRQFFCMRAQPVVSSDIYSFFHRCNRYDRAIICFLYQCELVWGQNKVM